ncbi:hypothetical protein JCM3775_001592 [Rhodotorula graminis]
MQAQAPSRAPLKALLAIRARLSPPPPPLAPDSAAPPRSALDTATAGLHTWLGDLAALDGQPPDADSDLAALVREKHLSYKVPSGAEKEKGAGPDGTKAVAMLDAMRDLVTWLLDRVLDKGEKDKVARGWDEVLVAVLLGIERHLRDNDFDDGRTPDEVLKYRKLFYDRLYKPLLRVVFPTLNATAPAGLVLVTGQTVDAASSSRTVPRWAKYAALATLAASMSKNKYAKSTLRALLPPDYLAAIFQSGADSHLSHLALEVAFRIAPPAPKAKSRESSTTAADKAQAEERKTFVVALFPPSRFGYDCVKLQKRFDELTVVDWFEQTSRLLQEIADGHIKRAQPFRVLSLDYNGYPLLDRPHDSQRPSSAVPDKPDLDEIADGFYESNMLWFGRHELAIDLHEPPEMVERHKEERRRLGIESTAAGEDEGDGYEVEKERAVVELSAVHAVHVDDLGTDLELMRVMFIIADSSPLKLGNRAHPSEATHIGTARMGETESQAPGIGIFHKLVVVIPTLGNNLGVFKKAIEERGSIYKMLRPTMLRYPMRVPVLPPVDDRAPPKPAPTAAPPKPVAPKPVAPKPVTSKVVTPKRSAPDPFAAAAADKRKSGGGDVAKVSAVDRTPRKSSQAGPVVAEPSPPPLVVDSEGTSQEEEARRRRKEVAQLADLAVGSSPVQAGPLREGEGKGKEGRAEDAMELDQEFGGGRDEDEDEEMEETAHTDSIVEESVELYGPSHKKAVVPVLTSKPSTALAKRALRRTASDLTDPDSAGRNSASLEVGKPRVGHAAASTSAATSTTSKKVVADKPAPTPSTAAPAGQPEFKVPAKKVARAQRTPAGAIVSAHAPASKKVVPAAVEAASVPQNESAPTHLVEKVVVAARVVARHEDDGEREPASKDDESARAADGKSRPRRAAASKAEAKFKGSKRRRADDDAETSDASAADADDDGDDDNVDEAIKKKAPARGKKAVKDSAAAPPPATKRSKKTPAPAPEPDSPLTSEPATDYDDEGPLHASLSTTRRSEPTAKKYGRQTKAAAPAAKTRKAATSRAKVTSPVKKRQSKKRVVEKKDDEQESEGDEKDEETPRSRTTRSRGAAAKKKVVVQSPHASAAEDVSPRKKGDKRVSDDIPPPRDLDADELKRVKEFEALKKPRSSEGAQKEKAVRSFSQLVSRDRIRTPPDEVMPEAEPLGGVGSEDRAAHIEGEDDSFDPGFFPDDLALVPALDALAPCPPHAQNLLGVADHGNAPPRRREASPSPFLDPAKDETFVDRAVPAAKERPAILVPDSPPQAAAAAAKARAVTAPALSSPHPQRHPQQPQHPPPRPPKPVVDPVATSPAHEPMQVDSPAGPHGADDSGVHFAPPLGERSAGKTPHGVQHAVPSAAAASTTAARAGPSATVTRAGLGALPSGLKFSGLGHAAPTAPNGAPTTASRAFEPATTAAVAVAGPSSARPASAFTFSPPRTFTRPNVAPTRPAATTAARTPWSWARPEVDQATQVGASLETGHDAPHQHEPQREPRSPHKEHAYLDAASLRAKVGPPPPPQQLVRRPFEAAPRAAPAASRRFVPATSAASYGRSAPAVHSAQSSASRSTARDRSSFSLPAYRPLGPSHAPLHVAQYQARASLLGPSTSTPRRAAGGGAGGAGAAVPSPARAQKQQARAQQQPQQQEGGEADGAWEDDDETLLRFSEEFGRALVDKQRERRERRRAVVEAGMRRHNAIVGQYVDEVKAEALSLASLVADRAAHHASQCAPEHATTRAIKDVGDKAREIMRWVEEAAAELGDE